MKRSISWAVAIAGIGLIIWCIVMGVWASIRASDTEGIALEAFDLMNEYRVERDLPKLLWDKELADLAVKHGSYMEHTGNFNHSDYPYVENILEGTGSFPSGNSVISPWMYSFGHRMNILNSKITTGAVGIVGNYATFLAR